LTELFFAIFKNKILNKHPSLQNGMGGDADPSNILERSSRPISKMKEQALVKYKLR
jgi:folate-dependent phosphoribosylglycinamide formyltransferase PurN